MQSRKSAPTTCAYGIGSWPDAMFDFKLQFFESFWKRGKMVKCFTPPKTNMELENHPFEKENHLNQTSVFGFHVSFRGCNLFRYTNHIFFSPHSTRKILPQDFRSGILGFTSDAIHLKTAGKSSAVLWGETPHFLRENPTIPKNWSLVLVAFVF